MRRTTLARIFALAAALMLAMVPLEAQVTGGARPSAVAVFLDCQTHGCDSEHFRNEITFVNWVRDRTVADVHVLITGQMSGSGAVYQLAYIGLRDFAGDSTTLTAEVSSVQTQSESRDVLTNRLAQGLLSYAMRTTAADRIRISYDIDEDEQRAGTGLPVDDPWNFWVFSASLNGSTDGEARDKSREFEVSINASRTTADWKVGAGLEGSYDENEFQLVDRTRTIVRKNWEFEAGIGKTIARLWSAGLMVETGRSTFQNQEFYSRLATVLEYSLFPYEEFSRRRVTLQYSLGARHVVYDEITIFDRTNEQRADHRLELSANFRQPWGSLYSSVSGAHYLHDFSRYNLGIHGGVDLRLFRGFSLDVNGGYSRVHDQLNIPRGDADDEDIFLELQQLETNYRYDMSIGLRYTFGSLYNNIVNPRLDVGGGGGNNRRR